MSSGTLLRSSSVPYWAASATNLGGSSSPRAAIEKGPVRPALGFFARRLSGHQLHDPRSADFGGPTSAEGGRVVGAAALACLSKLAG